MKRLIALFLMLILILSATGCGKGVKIGVHTPSVECGKYYRIPELIGVDGEVKYTATDPDGKKVQIRSGTFQMTKTGDYTICYEYDGKVEKFTVKCTPDVSAPVMTEPLEVRANYSVGDTYMPYGGELFDPSGLDYTVCYNYRYYFEDETEPLQKQKDIDGNETNDLYIDRAGKYTIVVPAKDLIGNEREFVYSFTATEIYSDKDLAENYIATFDDEGYLQYVSSSNAWGDAVDEFKITTEYPGALSDSQNKVLHAQSPGKYSPYYDLKFKFMEEIPAEDIKYVLIRFCAVKKTGFSSDGKDYSTYPFMLYSVPYSNLDSQIATDLITDGVGYSFAMSDGAWTVARIPVSYLLSKNEQTLKGIQLCTSATLYIDDIWYSNEEFVDTNLENNVVADFDEYEYLFQVTKSKIGDTPVIDVLSDGYPKAEQGNGVLKIGSATSTANATVDIKLFNKVNINEYKYVKFRMYYDGRIEGSLTVKSKIVFMYHDLKDFYNDEIFEHYVTDTNAGEYQALWREYTVPTSIFVKHDGGYALENTFDTITILIQGTAYIDKIWLSN